MKNIKIIKKRRELGLSQEELGSMVGVTKSSISLWESGAIIPRGKNLINLCKIFNCPTSWILDEENRDLTSIVPNNEKVCDIETVEYNNDSGLINVPTFQEILLSETDGVYGVRKNNEKRLEIPKKILEIAEVKVEWVVCAKIPDNSMEPLIPKRTIFAVNTFLNKIEDNELYLINTNGFLQVRYLYRLGGNSFRLRAFNEKDYPEQIVSKKDNEIEILGKVFWYSVLLHN